MSVGNPPAPNHRHTSDWWQRDHSESSSMKTKKGAMWSDAAFYDKSLHSPETICGWNKLGWGGHYWRFGRLGLWCPVLSSLGSQVERQKYHYRPQPPLSVHVRVIGTNPGITRFWSQESCSPWGIHRCVDDSVDCYWCVHKFPVEWHAGGYWLGSSPKVHPQLACSERS